MRLILFATLALIATPALAGWDPAVIVGPLQVPVFGAPVTDPVTGAVSTPIVGYLGDTLHPTANPYCLVMPADKVGSTPSTYVQDVPPGLPLLEGVPSKAVCTPDEATARALPYLAMHWTDSSIVP